MQPAYSFKSGRTDREKTKKMIEGYFATIYQSIDYIKEELPVWSGWVLHRCDVSKASLPAVAGIV